MRAGRGDPAKPKSGSDTFSADDFGDAAHPVAAPDGRDGFRSWPACIAFQRQIIDTFSIVTPKMAEKRSYKKTKTDDDVNRSIHYLPTSLKTICGHRLKI